MKIYATPDALADACARHIARRLDAALASEPFASLAISGGATPKLMFRKLAAAQLAWARVRLFWVDERSVPPASDQSNYRLAKENLIDPAGIPESCVYRIRGELDPGEAAAAYVRDISDCFHLAPGELPSFHVIHLGVGPDAHTASLFPGEPLIEDRKGIAAPVFARPMQQWRVTLLPGALLAARNVVIQAQGAEKAEAVRAALRAPYEPLKYPAQLCANRAEWFLDLAAAQLLEPAGSGGSAI